MELALRNNPSSTTIFLMTEGRNGKTVLNLFSNNF